MRPRRSCALTGIATFALSAAVASAAGLGAVRLAHPSPIQLQPSGLSATGGIADVACNHGRGVDVASGVHPTAGAIIDTASTTLSNGETIVAFGPLGTSAHPSTKIWGFTAQCALLQSFGRGGSEELTAPDGAHVQLLAPSAHGDILIGAIGARGNILLGRMLPNGVMDRSFAKDGWSALSWQGFPTAIDQEPSGMIVLADSDNGGCCGFNWVAALSSRGEVDRAFGSGGRTRIPIDGEDLEISRIGLESNGDVLALSVGGHMGMWVAYPTELTPRGTVVSSFAKNFTTTFQRVDPSGIFTGDLVPRGDGFLLVGTRQDRPVSAVPDPSAVGRIAFFGSDGLLDPKFASDGQASFSSPLLEEVTALPVRSGGVLVIGTSPALEEPIGTNEQVLRVVALSADGGVNPTYGVSGQSRIDIPYPSTEVVTTLVSRSERDGVLVVGSQAGFQLLEFRLS